MRSGDIDSRYVDSSVMQHGSRAHRKIQKSMGKNYKSEVPLKIETDICGIPVILTGRADGIITGPDGGIIIDEIKATTLPLDRLFAQHELHTGQARCYAWMLFSAMESPPESVTVQLTYFQLDTQETKRHHFDYTYSEIEAFFVNLIARYSVWIKLEREWREARDISIKSTAFPYPQYRKGQRELAVAAYRTIERERKLYVQAPTGIGKTMSVLFPAIKAVGEEKAGKLFYLTAKTITRTVAEEAVQQLADGGLRFKSVTLRAKDKICFLEERICTPDHCEHAKGHFDRVGDALLDILNAEDIIRADTVISYSQKHNVCPYEFSLDIALQCDLIICDYNYAFDPVASLRRFFPKESSDYVFLIDEAHNLGERVRKMYTADISKSRFLAIKRELKDKNAAASRLKKAANRVNSYLLSVRKSVQGNVKVDFEADKVLAELVLAFTGAAEEWLAGEQHSGHSLHSDILELYFEASFYLGIDESFDGHYVRITETFGSDVKVTLFCLDPAKIISEKLGYAKASIMFSATLTPLPYYRELLGGGGDDYILSLGSPFPRENLLIAAHYGISTKYNDREHSMHLLSEAVGAVVTKKKGNYLVFFPSYSYMQSVYDSFINKFPGINTIVQQTSMSEDERTEFLAKFDCENSETMLAFCVLGGIFSEGIDLVGDRLYGVIAVGVGLPKITLRQDLIQDYYNTKNNMGFDFAYMYPGMNKIMQAAGRVIRSENDRGIVLLIDSRYNTGRYRRLYPPWWSGMPMIKQIEQFSEMLDRF